MSAQHVLHGNNLELLARMPDASVHAVVTDPPYGLGFMGKDWDKALPDPRTWSECLRVLRPGGHLVAFGAPRLVHRLTCQIEDAGFEVRDQLLWVFGCLSEDTEILVNGEWVHYRKAMAGSLAMCYDIDDDTFSEQPIEKLFVYDYDDTAYRIQSDGTDQIVSRTHKCIVQRGGRWVFDTAENVAREQEARVPILQDVRGLLSGLSMREQNAGGAEQEVRGLRDEETQRAAQKEADERTLGHDTDSVPRVQRRSVEACGVGVARGRSNVLIPMQRETAGGGAGQALAQGARGVDCGEPADLHGEDDRREQPGLEGWGHAQARQGELHRTEVREVPAGVSSNGSQGRLCDGASTGASEGDRPLLDAHRSGPPREPRQPGQPDREPDVVREQQGPQAVRASRFTASDLAAITPIHYTGKVWCVKVPTGAFVARRNGKIFVTGNSGFPKSLDVSKAIDAAAGAVRDVVGPGGRSGQARASMAGDFAGSWDATAPATPEAAKWSGWGTALKPAYEPIVLARKPLDGTVAQTAQRWGTGALNIDGCRVAGDGAEAGRSRHGGGTMEGASFQMPDSRSSMPAGRWPANLILSDDGPEEWRRYFYCPKASRGEREAGLGHLPPRTVDPSRVEDTPGRDSPRAGAGRGSERRNHHATVKPLDLMRWLVRLVTPPGGIVLEPFAGSGTTPAACALEGVDCIAMEIDAEYVEIARARVAHWRTVR